MKGGHVAKHIGA